MLSRNITRALIVLLSLVHRIDSALGQDEYDVVIYGGTSAGIAAAVQVSRMGHSVIVIEPSRRIGGLTTGGLGQTDIGNKAAIGGISREFYQKIRQHYDQPSSWKWQDRAEYASGGQSRTSAKEDTLWVFEPSAALKVMQDFVDEHKIPVVYKQRIDRSGHGVQKTGTRISSIRMESGKVFRGKTFLDTTYEGDLLAESGVDYIVGREANATYEETLSGVQTKRAVHHQFVANVDPYVTAGDPASGLLPGVDPDGPGEEGTGDKRVQAFCFRMCLTDHPENRIPFDKPPGYVEQQYELLFRNFEAGSKDIPWANSGMPNRKTDVNNNKGFSTDFIGQNYDYPIASYADRERIVERHRDYQRGLMWTLSNHPRVPDHVRKQVSRWGTCKDEFERADGWQQQLYIREARRMIGQYVMTQHNCQGQVVAEQPIGLAAYTMDSHNVQRHVTPTGFVSNEGDVQVGGFSPYTIDYGSIVPKQEQCSNLLVPVCLSASHMAFGSIRMEPVFMALAQSAATAAVHSVQQDVAVQNVDFSKLQERLLSDKQNLVWTGPKRVAVSGIEIRSLAGMVIDDEQSDRSGFDTVSSSIGPFVGVGYRHDGDDGKGRQSATFRFLIKTAGTYKLRMAYSPNANRATNVPVTVIQNRKAQEFSVNQRQKPDAAPFVNIAVINLDLGEATVTVSNKDTDGYVLIDAIQLVPANGTN